MFRAPSRPKPRRSELATYSAPVAGWISNRNLALPKSGPQGAQVLENFFPTAQGAVLRRGSASYAELAGESVKSLFKYVNSSVERLFGATEDAIYDITAPLSPENVALITDAGEPLETDEGDTIGTNSTDGLDVMTGLTGGDWSVVQFATSGGVYLVGVNGSDPGFVFDGDAFYPQVKGGVYLLAYDEGTGAFTVGETVTGASSGATGKIYKIVPADPDNPEAEGVLWLTDVAGGPFTDDEAISDGESGSAKANGAEAEVPGTDVSFKDDPGLTTADLAYVWAYKQRLYFIEKGSLNVWYLDVDQVAGELTALPLGGVFPLGGSLVFGQTWSLDSGEQGGLSEQCIFVSSEGEVAVYQGLSPEDTDTWGKTGIYRIGTPLGPRAWMRAGGDIIISTTIGKIPLSQAIRRDIAALAPVAVSYPIEEAWREAVETRGKGWQCHLWPEGQMVVVAPPSGTDVEPRVFAANAQTGAWATFTGWDVHCWCTFRGNLYFGSTGGMVIQAYVTGSDRGVPYTGRYLPLFDDQGNPASLKIAEIARHTVRAVVELNETVSAHFDFDTDLPPAPSSVMVPVGSQWGNAVWGDFTWGARLGTVLNHRWHSVGGTGYAIAPALQITSGSVAPLDAEIIRSEVTYQAAAIVT